MESDGVLEMYHTLYKCIMCNIIHSLEMGIALHMQRSTKADPTVQGYIQKEERVNHVTKQMGSKFRRLRKECKGKKPQDGNEVGGKRRLTNVGIDATKIFYG